MAMMNPRGRWIYSAVAALLTGGCAHGGGPVAIGGSNQIDVALDVQDEQGHAIPYATVWGYVLPRRNPLAIDGDDLWRITTRYQASFEFAFPFGGLPVPYLKVLPMANGVGRFEYNIDYRFEEGSAAKRPENMSVGFAVMKRGYLPARIDFAVTNESRLSGKVILRLDPESAIETQPYLTDFQRLRYEASDWKRNEEISASNHQRMERLQRSFESAAQRALDAGDKKAAARIYARMEYLPSMVLIGGKAAGFLQANSSSPQAKAYLARAYSLDPANCQIAAEVLFDEGAERYGRSYVREKASAEERRAFDEYLLRLHALMRTCGKALWPTFHEIYALWLKSSSNVEDRERVRPLLEELYRLEPKYETHEHLMSSAR